MSLFCMACSKPTGSWGMFCSQDCNDRQALDPDCPIYDVATGRLERRPNATSGTDLDHVREDESA